MAINNTGARTGDAFMENTMKHRDHSCIFCKIVAKEIPSRIVYEDDEFFAFHDINPWAPVHFLIIPKTHIASMAHIEAAHAGMMGRMMALVPKLAQQEGCNPYPEGGFRLLTNTGQEGGQEVHHLHFHVMGGTRPWARG
jgi:histidine triad (HIT) family protein